MNILLWILLGLAAGWLASVVMGTRSRQGIGMDILLGMVGAVIGGFIFSAFGQTGITGFNLYSLIVATIGAMIMIWLVYTLRTSAR